MPDFKEYSQQIMHKALNIGSDLISQDFQLTSTNELEDDKAQKNETGSKLDKNDTQEDETSKKHAREEDSKEERHTDPRGRKVYGKFTAQVLGTHEPEQGRNNS